MKKVITYGTYDLLHEEHIKMLKYAKSLGDYLIVWLSTDEFNDVKWKKSFLPYEQRKIILESIKYVDEVIPENNRYQKAWDIKMHNIDILCMWADWKNCFDYLKTLCSIKYHENRWKTSTTNIKKNIKKIIENNGNSKKVLWRKSALVSIATIPIFTIFSYLIPKKKWLYLFGSIKWEKCRWNSKYLFHFYKNQKDTVIEPIYMTYNKQISQKDNFCYVNSLKGVRNVLRAEHLFLDAWTYAASPAKALLGKFFLIRLWHGDTIKKIVLDDPNISKIEKILIQKQTHNTSLITVWSAINQERMNNAFGTNIAQITWLARYDQLFHDPQNTILQDLKQKYKKLILYTPTRRDNQEIIKPLSSEWWSAINEYCTQENALFLIKKHPNTKKIFIDKQYSHIYSIDNLDIEIQIILYYADILITDYSSIYIDYLLTNRPVIFYAYDKEQYVRVTRWLYEGYEDSVIGEWIITSEEDLLKFIQSNQHQNSWYQKEYKKVKDKFHYYQSYWFCSRIDEFVQSI